MIVMGMGRAVRTADYLVVFPLRPAGLSFEHDDQPCSYVFNIHPLLRALDTAEEDDSLYLVLGKGEHCLMFQNDQRLRRFKWKECEATEFKATALAEWNNRGRIWVDATNFVCILDYYFNILKDLLDPISRIKERLNSQKPTRPAKLQARNNPSNNSTLKITLQAISDLRRRISQNRSPQNHSEGIGLFDFPRTTQFGNNYLKSVIDFILQIDGVRLIFSEEPYIDSILCDIEEIREMMFYVLE
ncbi:hypothetical protein Q3G72_031709 [Acer saccharum]|nr:hypothetical protein Q3G72_031709 [Acer saccharum]